MLNMINIRLKFVFMIVMIDYLDLFVNLNCPDLPHLKMWYRVIPDNSLFQQDVMPPIMAISNDGQDHKDKYFDTSRKILSEEVTMYNMEAFGILSLRSYDQSQFYFNCSNVKVKRLTTYKNISSKGILI